MQQAAEDFFRDFKGDKENFRSFSNVYESKQGKQSKPPRSNRMIEKQEAEYKYLDYGYAVRKVSMKQHQKQLKFKSRY